MRLKNVGAIAPITDTLLTDRLALASAPNCWCGWRDYPRHISGVARVSQIWGGGVVLDGMGLVQCVVSVLRCEDAAVVKIQFGWLG